jgi:cell division control protein 24
VFVKVRSGDANFVIPVQSDVSYRTLYEKVVKKLRICSARHTAAGLDVVVKIKWLDSDGDEVVIKTDSDVQIMLLEAASEQIQLIAT